MPPNRCNTSTAVRHADGQAPGQERPHGTLPHQILAGGQRTVRAGLENRLRRLLQSDARRSTVDRLLSSYPTAGVLRQAGGRIDYVCPHHYDCEDLAADEENDLNGSRPDPRPVAEAAGQGRGDGVEHDRRRLGAARAPSCGRWRTRWPARATTTCCTATADFVDIANRSNLTNSFCSGIIQTDNHRLYKTPTYYAQQLYATLAGNRPLVIESKTPASLGPDFSAQPCHPRRTRLFSSR